MEKIKILVVDDARHNRTALREILNDNYIVLEAENGQNALAVLEEKYQAVTVIILDLIMPDMSGLELLEIFHKDVRYQNIPVIAMLRGINDEMHLLSPIIIEPIQRLKVNYLGNHNPRLHSDEILIALSICAATNPTAALAMQQLSKLRGCEAHASVILSRVDENVYQKLGVNLTCEPKYQTKKLYHA